MNLVYDRNILQVSLLFKLIAFAKKKSFPKLLTDKNLESIMLIIWVTHLHWFKGNKVFWYINPVFLHYSIIK